MSVAEGNSAALSIFDSVGAGTAVAASGIVSTSLAPAGAGFAGVFSLTAVIALLAAIPAVRLVPRHAPRPT